MKIVELINKVQLPISNEEADILGKFNESAEVQKADLSAREMHVANQLVNKDVLLRKNQNGRITYTKKIPE
jgi:hypothetical protein